MCDIIAVPRATTVEQIKYDIYEMLAENGTQCENANLIVIGHVCVWAGARAPQHT